MLGSSKGNMQMHPLELAHVWLRQARADAESARYNFDGKRFDVCCFLCQQAVEKALKALLIWRNGDRPRIHFIQKLLLEIAEAGIEITEEVAEIRSLDLYYTSSRYPDALGGAEPALTFSSKPSEAALGYVDLALNFVAANLPAIP